MTVGGLMRYSFLSLQSPAKRQSMTLGPLLCGQVLGSKGVCGSRQGTKPLGFPSLLRLSLVSPETLVRQGVCHWGRGSGRTERP